MLKLGRKLLALLATLGLLSAIAVYGSSFFETPWDILNTQHHWFLVFLVGFFLLYLPVVISEMDGPLSNRKLFWIRFQDTRPPGILRFIQVLFIIAVIHMAIFFVISHGSVPDVINGQYILNNHGTLENVTRSQYLCSKQWELRFFSSFMVCIYLYLAAYWWGPRVTRKPGPYGD